MTQQSSVDHESALNWSNPVIKEAVSKRGDPKLPPAFHLPKSKIWAPQYIIQASPLTKLFMSEWSKRCLNDTKLLAENVQFEVRIPRASGGVVMKHNVPQHVSTLLPTQDTREVSLDEVTPLVHWLCGGPDGAGEETDIYGVVAIEVGMDVTADIVGMLTQGMSVKSIKEKQDEIIKGIQDQIVVTREIADKRVKRALKATYNNLVAEWERIKQAGGGVYAPSVSEALSAHILNEEIQKHAETTKAAFDLVAKAMKNPVGV